MTRLVVIGVLAVLMVSVVPVAMLRRSKNLRQGILFGGLHGMANETTVAVNSTLDDLGAIAEDYTATWCGNCVEVGNALEDCSGEHQHADLCCSSKHLRDPRSIG